MPTVYAHWVFGEECYKQMPKNIQDIIRENRDLYNLGVHGPDIFFYDLLDSRILKYGSKLHNIPAEVFFKKAKLVYDKNGKKDEMLAYLLGYLTHFVLDSSAHSYIEHKRQHSKVTHSLIESQWDRHLILLDNRQSNLVDRSETLKPNRENAKIISLFYPFNSFQVLKACYWQKYIIRALNCISIRKQNILQKILLTFKQYFYVDLFVGFEEDKRCRDSNLRLDKIDKKALKLYSKLMNNLINYLKGKQDLDEYFNYDLEYRPEYKDIPVLSYKEELAYIVK